MLQQTQADRVVPKYLAFTEQFRDFPSLAMAPLAQVLTAWQGLGYNRRALMLHRAAQIVVSQHGGKLPQTVEELDALPGIGRETAGSIAAFGFNQPVAFIETNIRTVFIHFFFPKRKKVHDNELRPLVEKMVDRDNPREWYQALMDYGVMLKRSVGNVSQRSTHYAKQSSFKESNRRIRGLILKLLTMHDTLTAAALQQSIPDCPPERLRTNLTALATEGFIKKSGERYRLA